VLASPNSTFFRDIARPVSRAEYRVTAAPIYAEVNGIGLAARYCFSS
jgi:hypothetical protein